MPKEESYVFERDGITPSKKMDDAVKRKKERGKKKRKGVCSLGSKSTESEKK